MRRFWMVMVVIGMVLGLLGCQKKEIGAPEEKKVEEQIGESEEMEEIETPMEEETEEPEGLEEEGTEGLEEEETEGLEEEEPEAFEEWE